MSTIIRSISSAGGSGSLVDIECGLSNNLPNIIIVGSANRAVGEAKERIRGAFVNSKLVMPRKRVTINLAPAEVPKADSGFDLAIAVSILSASQQIPASSIAADQVYIGELGLSGDTRPVRGIIGKLLAGRTHGLTSFYIPAANLQQALLVPNITLIPVKNLKQLFEHLNGTLSIKPIQTNTKLLCDMQLQSKSNVHIWPSEIVGHDRAKQALLIAAAGGHNICMLGPPGTGKSMLAQALASLLPPLTHEEMLEVTHLHSLTGFNYEQLITDRPFRTPHHSASQAALIGGGSSSLFVRPGEISLAHRGVLLLDEFPEFDREAMEALRQPLEDHRVTLARARETTSYPAHFTLVATANPCPCGYHGYSSKCRCNTYRVNQYQQRISGPILDRIDLFTSVDNVSHSHLLTSLPDPESDHAMAAAVQKARGAQAKRYGSSSKLNVSMSNADIRKYCYLDRAATTLLNDAATSMQLSSRAYMRSLRVARTLADLEASHDVQESHVAGALAYRQPVFVKKEDQ